MQLWQDGVIAGLASIGLASLLWLAVRRIFAQPDYPRYATALLMACGEGTPLEPQLRALQHLCREYGMIDRILVADCGLSPEGRKAAELLARQDRRVTLCRAEDVPQYLAGISPAAIKNTDPKEKNA